MYRCVFPALGSQVASRRCRWTHPGCGLLRGRGSQVTEQRGRQEVREGEEKNPWRRHRWWSDGGSLINRSRPSLTRKGTRRRTGVGPLLRRDSPSCPATIPRGWDERAGPCWEFLSTVGESAGHRGRRRLTRARGTAAT